MKRGVVFLCTIVIVLGAVAVASAGVFTEPEITALLISPTYGDPPLDVDFNLAIYNPDPIPIVLYEWDFEGDGTFDFSSAASPIASYTYTVLGTFLPTARITWSLADNGQQWGTDTKSGTVNVGTQPVPEPTTMLLLGTGLLGLAGWGRKRFKK